MSYTRSVMRSQGAQVGFWLCLLLPACASPVAPGDGSASSADAVDDTPALDGAVVETSGRASPDADAAVQAGDAPALTDSQVDAADGQADGADGDAANDGAADVAGPTPDLVWLGDAAAIQADAAIVDAKAADGQTADAGVADSAGADAQPDAAAADAKVDAAAKPDTSPPPSDVFHLPFACGTSHPCTAGNGQFHHSGLSYYGFDFSMAAGTPIVASQAGKVTAVHDTTGPGDPCYQGCKGGTGFD
ncbi:MAG: hypothetical protein EXR77_10525, partial [Myxococcales bacterium]|nr:hypothetical protein [Myxococcales bacterium]